MDKKLQVVRQFIEAIPHSKALGMRLTDMGEGTATIVMPYDPALIGDPETRYREDPVRMLRAVRLAAKLRFDIDPASAAPIAGRMWRGPGSRLNRSCVP